MREHLGRADRLWGDGRCRCAGRGARRTSTASSCPAGSRPRSTSCPGSSSVREPLVAALRAGLPAYGSCAGMILLADRVLDGTADQQTFGGLAITVRRNAFGRQVESFEADVELAGVTGGPVHAVFIRAPWVERVDDRRRGARRRSRRPGIDEAKIIAVRQGNLLATVVPSGGHRRPPDPPLLPRPGPRRLTAVQATVERDHVSESGSGGHSVASGSSVSSGPRRPAGHHRRLGLGRRDAARVPGRAAAGGVAGGPAAAAPTAGPRCPRRRPRRPRSLVAGRRARSAG